MKHLIWLASYPKSGNTWLRILLDSILRLQGEAVDINQISTGGSRIIQRSQFDAFLEFDSTELTMPETRFFKRKFYLEYGRTAKEDVFIKTHEANLVVDQRECLIPKAVTKLGIYIVRNPLDVVSSLAGHYEVSIDRAIGIMNSKDFTSFRPKEGVTSNVPEYIGDWSLHVNSWLESKSLPLLLVRYEDLLQHPIDTLKRIVGALDQSIERTVLERAVENCSFGKLAAQESREGFREKMVNSGSFFRKGRSGSWREELTAGQVRLVLNAHEETMDAVGYRGLLN